MTDNKLIEILKPIFSDNPAVNILDKEKGILPLTSLVEEALVISLSYLKKPRPILVIKNNMYNAQRLYERMVSFLGEDNCVLFSADESLRVAAIASSPEITANKVDTLSILLKDANKVVITCPSGLLRHLPSPQTFQSCCIKIKTGDILSMDTLQKALLSGGYYKTAHIDQPLCFAARGGIVDIYSISYENPIRVEFFDDEVDSIRFFDVSSQKTVSTVNEVEIVPASEVLFSDKETEEILHACNILLEETDDPILNASIEADLSQIEARIRENRLYPYSAFLSNTAGLWDYMNNPVVIFSDEDLIRENIKRMQEDTISYIQEMAQEKKMLPKFSVFHDIHEIEKKCKVVKEDPFADNVANINELHLPNETLDIRLSVLKQYGKVLFCLNGKESEKVIEQCITMKSPYHLVDDTVSLADGFNMLFEPIAEGFVYLPGNLTIVSSSELFEIRRYKGRYEKKFRSAEVINDYEELDIGDYIVHAQHGVGQYMGIETREVRGTIRDFLRIIYRGNAELLVPLEQFRLVRKFVSREGVVPRLNKLGSTEWEKTKKRLEENVTDIAERLVQLYAVREEHIGHAFQPDNELQKEFEDSFEFELTPDQKQAVIDVKKDMETDRPMDRLICGDVGFGKTEVAVTAAFKAVSENKQVAVLCPTTILAEQHYRTFSKRFDGYPFTVKVLDRFVRPQQVKETLEGCKNGTVDILIGTHRILSKDVVFKDLGLLVVDEEQRFGVEHKEKIKEMKNTIDVLTLSATPIPRTLQMSLIGIRQLSQLETPPENRYDVQTYVVEKNNGLVVDAIEKELSRDGQVFYLYNNISQIYNIARGLQMEIPDARIGIVHGKMDRESIEDVMMQFIQKELNVLVCTTIIENGIDIPNANTILIDNAQDFGLSQIYQIKGRVGRSDRVAYAYLLVPPRKQLSEVASKRLQAVKEFAKLGSGYRIAMRDLTIRGAGDLLGPEQSGFIDTVGIDMYIEMLNEAIEKKKGNVVEKPVELKHVNVSMNSYIPKNFSPDDYDKLGMYQKIDAIVTEEELDQFKNDVIDQYGRLPETVETLFEKKSLDILVNRPEIQNFREVRGMNEITFSKQFSQKLDGVKLFEIFSDISRDIALQYKNQSIIASVPAGKDSLKICAEVMERAKEALRNEGR